jgi:hypothetical protein
MVAAGGERVGVLVLRVWLEGSEPGASLRARVTETTDVTDERSEQTYALAGAEEACGAVCRWLRRFAGGEPDAGEDAS